jgi:hypothetical protein
VVEYKGEREVSSIKKVKEKRREGKRGERRGREREVNK